MDTASDSPRYRRAPVVEVVLAVAFEPTDLSSLDFAVYWRERLASQGLTRFEEQAPLVPPIERFGEQNAMRAFKLTLNFAQPSARRMWFMGEDGYQLVQVQSDWVARNWRRSSGPGSAVSVYPHFESVRDPFMADLEAFSSWLGERGKSFNPVQCEVSYINHIEPDEHWQKHADIESVLRLRLNPAPSTDRFLPPAEDILMTMNYLIVDGEHPIGRLHAEVQPAYRSTDLRPLFSLNLTARGVPRSQDIDGVRDFLDIGHNWVVRGFTELTTPEMHKSWNREV